MSLTVGDVTQLGAWDLLADSAFFIALGALGDRDYFLTLGLLCCTAGNAGFALYLADQSEGSLFDWASEEGNATYVTVYALLCVACVAVLLRQLNEYRLKGFHDEEEEEEEEGEGEGEGGEGEVGAQSEAAVPALPAPPAAQTKGELKKRR